MPANKGASLGRLAGASINGNARRPHKMDAVVREEVEEEEVEEEAVEEVTEEEVARIRIRSAWPRDPEPSLDTRSPFPSPDVTYVQHFASSFPF
ncbi:unnamed protein product [Gadus morhua 'NCC']